MNSHASSIPPAVVAGNTGRFGVPWAELAIAGLFFLAAFTAISVARAAGTAALVWTANALAAALLVRLPRVRWVVAFVAIGIAGLLANMLSAHDRLHWSAAMMCINLAEIGGTVYLFRRVVIFPLPNISFLQGVRMVALFALVMPALGALPGGWIVHEEFGAPRWSATLEWLRAGAIGSSLCAPAIYLFSRRTALRLVSPRYLSENLVLALICVATTYFAIRFVRFPFVVLGTPLIVTAFRMGSFGAAVLSGVCGAIVIGMWSVGIHPAGLEHLPVAKDIAGLPFLALLMTILPPMAVGLATDQRRLAIRALRFSERQFRQSVAHSPIGMIISELDGTLKVANSTLLNMLGYSEAELTAAGWKHIVHPDHHADVLETRLALLSGAIDRFDAERRYLHKSGEWRWLRVAISLVRDEDGRPLHFIRHVEDFEQRRRAERELAVERQRLITTLRAIADAVVTTDAAGCITYINAAANELLGHAIEAVQGRRFYDVVAMTDPLTSRSSEMVLGKCLARGEVVRRTEALLLHRPDGGLRYVTKVASPLFGEDGQVTGAVLVLRDAGADYERDRKLSHLATHDVLTGLCNRFEFERRLQALFERAKLLVLPATLLAVDLDRFKAVNDEGGHAAGDAVLRRVGEVLSATVRNTDTVARVGGDEFAIVLEKCTTEHAHAVAAQILRAMNPLQLEWEGRTYSIGASVGVATLTDAYQNIGAWMAAADGACYEAKRAERGQLRFAQPGERSAGRR